MVANRPFAEGRAARVLVAVAFVMTAASDAGYLAIIRNQGSFAPDVLTVPFVAGYLVLMALLLGASLLEAPAVVRLRPALRGAAAGGLLPLGALALMSIGLPILIAGACATAAAVISARHVRLAGMVAIAAAVVAAAVLLGGLDMAWRYIECPASGEMSGSTVGIFGSGFSYECSDGVLKVTSG